MGNHGDIPDPENDDLLVTVFSAIICWCLIMGVAFAAIFVLVNID